MVLSSIYLSLKYPISNGCVVTVIGDQTIAQECYLSILEVTREPLILATILRLEMDDTDTTTRDLILRAESERLTLIEDLKEV